MPIRYELKPFLALMMVYIALAASPALAQCQADETVMLTASDAADSDLIGDAIAIAGDWTLVGSRGDDDAGTLSGSVYAFRFDGKGWFEQAKLTALDATDLDEFGAAVAMDGEFAVIGAPEPWLGQGDNMGGRAYVFRLIGSDWTQVAKLTASDATILDNFGFDVGISGDTVVVGAWQDDDAGDRSGSAYVFKRPPGGWSDTTENAKLTASDAAAFDELGRCVAVSGDVVVAGARGVDEAGRSGIGAAYVFEMPPGGWDDMTETGKLTASDARQFDFLGDEAVAIDGSVIMVGAPGHDDSCQLPSCSAGTVFVFNRPTGGWADMHETAKLRASDARSNDRFGYGVALDGDVAVVGALTTDDFAGAAYIFRFDGQDWIEEAKMTPETRATGDEFSRAVAVSGQAAAIGAYRNDSGGLNAGAAYVFSGLSDCDENGVLDLCDIAADPGRDANGNGLLDICEIGEPGDLNCDGQIDAFDIEPFLLALFEPGNYAIEYPDCDINLADINGDGSIDAFDIEPFLGILFP